MDQLITDGGANSKPLHCRHCGSQFLSADKAVAVEHPMSQTHFQGLSSVVANDAKEEVKEGGPTEGTTVILPSFWQISSMWDFDNFAQSRPVAVAATAGGGTASSSITPETVYVVCADCEKGPVGVRWKAGEPYYVSHSLITYEAKEGAPANGSLPAGMSEDFVRQLIAEREEQQEAGARGVEQEPVVVVEEEATAASEQQQQEGS